MIHYFPRIHRFPRIRRFPRHSLPLPAPGYLPGKPRPFIPTSQMMLLATDIARGEKIKDVLERHGCSRDQYGNLMRKRGFRDILYKETERYHREINARMKKAINRATSVLEETLDDDDPELRFQAAKETLKGRAVFKTSTQTKLDATVEHEHHHDHEFAPELQELFMKALIDRFSGTKTIDTVPLQLASGEVIHTTVEAV